MDENEGQKQDAAPQQQQDQEQTTPHQKIEVIVTSSGEVTGQKQTLGGLLSWWKYNFRRNDGKPDAVRRQVAILLHSMGGLTHPNILTAVSGAYFDESEKPEFDALLDEIGEVEKDLAQVRQQLQIFNSQGAESSNGASSAG